MSLVFLIFIKQFCFAFKGMVMHMWRLVSLLPYTTSDILKTLHFKTPQFVGYLTVTFMFANKKDTRKSYKKDTSYEKEKFSGWTTSKL